MECLFEEKAAKRFLRSVSFSQWKTRFDNVYWLVLYMFFAYLLLFYVDSLAIKIFFGIGILFELVDILFTIILDCRENQPTVVPMYLCTLKFNDKPDHDKIYLSADGKLGVEFSDIFEETCPEVIVYFPDENICICCITDKVLKRFS